MINILMPVAGYAKRFTDCGYELPKPLIPVSGVPMIKLAVQSLLPNANPKDFTLIFVVREDHLATHDIAGAFRNLFPDWNIKVSSVNHVTKGTLCSCLVATEHITNDDPLIIYTPDVCFESQFTPNDFIESGKDGLLLTFKANSPDHSYVMIDQNGDATRTEEKSVISNDALVGVYCFKTGGMFLKYANEALASGMTTKGEFYVSPMYNLLIRDGLKISICRTDKMYVLGTPDDLEFYEKHVSRYKEINKFALCCDHSGFSVKEKLIGRMKEMGIGFIDFGTYSDKDSDHIDALKPCIEHLLSTDGVIGIAMCSTGQGFNIAANKVRGVRSALVDSEKSAEMARRHNAANFFCFPASTIDPNNLDGIIKAILNNSFDGGRHATRIRRIDNDPTFHS